MKKLYQSNLKLIISSLVVFGHSTLLALKQVSATANLGTSFNITTFMGLFYRIAMPIAVVLALIFIAKAAYEIMFSEGDPRRVSEGKEDLTSAIMGLLFVLLSIAILRVIMGQIIIGGSAGF